MLLFPGTINNQQCQVLRDTGANVVGVKREFVRSKDYTGDKEICTLFNGETFHLDTAYVNLETPFFTGKTIAMVLNDCVADVIIGNIYNIIRT